MRPIGEGQFTISLLRESGIAQELLLAPTLRTETKKEVTSFADLPVPIMCLSPMGEIRQANRLAIQLVGEVELSETNISDIMQGLGYPLQEWLARAAEEGTTPRSEFLRLARKDKEVFVQVTLSRILKDGLVCLIAVLNDATELKTLEAQFVQGQKMQAVGATCGWGCTRF